MKRPSIREKKKRLEDEFDHKVLPSSDELSKSLWEVISKGKLQKYLCMVLEESKDTVVAETNKEVVRKDHTVGPDKFTFGQMSPRSKSDDIAAPIFEKTSSMKADLFSEHDNMVEDKDIPLLRAYSERRPENKNPNSGGFSFTKFNSVGLAAFGKSEQLKLNFLESDSNIQSPQADREAHQNQPNEDIDITEVAKIIARQLNSQL